MTELNMQTSHLRINQQQSVLFGIPDDGKQDNKIQDGHDGVNNEELMGSKEAINFRSEGSMVNLFLTRSSFQKKVCRRDV